MSFLATRINFVLHERSKSGLSTLSFEELKRELAKYFPNTTNKFSEKDFRIALFEINKTALKKSDSYSPNEIQTCSGIPDGFIPLDNDVDDI